MWQQQHQVDQKYEDNKHGMESTSGGDSGFISGSCICSSELSSTSLFEDIQSTSKDMRLTSVELPKLSAFGLVDYCYLSESFDHLSLNHNDSLVSGTACGSLDNQQESWQLHYTQNDDGDTLLHTAVIQGFFEATLSLINIAPHPDLLDILNDDCQAALHLAVITNQPKIVRSLVLAGANMSIKNYQGNTALHLACISGSLDCAKALTEPVAAYEQNLFSTRRLSAIPQNLELRNYHGETCLHLAASHNHVDLVRLLVRLGADIEAQESLAGRTALHLALEHSHLGVICYLLRECRPQLDAATYSGCTAYQIARCVDENLALELVRMGAEPAGLDDFRESAVGHFGATAMAQ
ncbi:NF-kappa-B inhibitor cactus-like [Copidosoma floridanum]|uniref:NF-kappa-B inhibitor cactus-like n=1 Tax=Copidosoma floridanum TaxID=29053 RepID=UPI0006C9CA7A|nr:NF-kappa-B inhibitor cactus-like [Copidosoma floridanum]